MRKILAAILLLWASISYAQFNGCPPGFCSAGGAGGLPPVTYQGPGDVAGAEALAWGSCARAYNAAYANGTNAMCDLQDVSTGTVAICTLRAATSGYVDLSGTYCTGGLSPADACAAAAGGSCVISKVYNQVSPGTLDFTQSALAGKPGIVFSDLSGLPTIDCARAGGSVVLATTNITQAQPMVFSAAYIRTGNFTTQQGVLGSSGGIAIGASVNADQAYGNGGATINIAGAIDNAWHGLNVTLNGVSGAYNIDGADTVSQNFGTTGFVASPIRFCRAAALQVTGRIAEGGVWTSSAVSRSALYSNQHGVNGYNGAF